VTRSELLVDGTNVAWAWERSRPWLIRKDHGAAQRALVSAALNSALRNEFEQITFVFDGPPPPLGPTSGPGLRVLYPDPGQTADERIVELAARIVHGGIAPVVATSDRGLRDLIRQQGGVTIGGQALIQKLEPRGAGGPARETSTPDLGEEKPRPSSRDTESWLSQFSRPRRHPK